jgi:multisubunit Na+/H+ antiporter MnhB subunit
MRTEMNPRARRVMLIGMVFLLVASLTRLLARRVAPDFDQGVIEGVTIGLYLVAIGLLLGSIWMRRQTR